MRAVSRRVFLVTGFSGKRAQREELLEHALEGKELQRGVLQGMWWEEEEV